MYTITTKPRVGPLSYDESGPKFWRVALRCCGFAVVLNIAFVITFYMLGAFGLASVSIGCAAAYAIVCYSLLREKYRLAVALVWLTVIAQTGLGTLFMGWDSGFHYYLIIVIPVLLITQSSTHVVFSLAGLWAAYFSLYGFSLTSTPLQPVSHYTQIGANMFNMSLAFGLFSYLSFYYLNLLAATQNKLRRLATVDPLTGLYNRRHASAMIEAEISRFKRTRRPVAFMLLDIDHFKSVNDMFGHEIGDRVLTAIGNVIPSQLRLQDVVSRWGGEEFLILLPDTDMENALISAERLRHTFAAHDWVGLTHKEVRVTVSVGVCELFGGENMASVIRRADEALYKAKAAGRNRVEGAIHAVDTGSQMV